MEKRDKFILKLSKIQPNLIVIGEYIDSYTKILVKDENNIEYLSKPTELLSGKIPTIRLAVDKNKCFVHKAEKIHKTTYDYSKINYTYNYKKIEIICSKHGSFFQEPGDHLKGNGCRKCSFEKQSYSFSDFIKIASEKYNNKYIYLKDRYINLKSRTIIICPIHGEFTQTPAGHLIAGCKKCGIEKSGNSQRLTLNEFILRSKSINGNKYSYKNSIYKSYHDKINVTCKIHGDFEQSVATHLSGGKCPKCVIRNGYSRTQWIKFCKSKLNSNPKVYIIRCYNSSEEFIKIGITTTSVRQRFSGEIKMPYSYEVLFEIKGSADFVFDKEKSLHKLYKDFRYKPLIYFQGETECFTTEILNSLPS